MDPFVLIAVASDLDRALRGATLAEFRQESADRFRAVFVARERGQAVVVSLRPERPWVGRPAARVRKERGRATAFASEVHRALHDRVVADVSRPGPGRALRISFVDGRALVAELAPHGANLVALDDRGAVLAAARHPRSSRERVAVGALYRPPDPPAGAHDPEFADPAAIDAAIAERLACGFDRVEAVRRALLGVGREVAAALVDEAVATGVTEGAAARAASGRLARGEDGPWEDASVGGGLPVLRPFTPSVAARAAGRDPGGAAAVAGRHHEALERASWATERRAGLAALLRREIARLERVARNVERDRTGFGDPEVHRLRGEALLAGLRSARREGGTVRVPNPYDPASTMSIEVDPATPLPRAADEQFARHRRAVRGLEAAGERLRTVRSRLEALVRLDRDADSIEAVEDLETAMRAAGIAVGLAAERRARLAELSAGARPRLEGVRMFSGAAGTAILAGKTARDNHHLTFRVAQPEDFWLHALGRTGAHVVLRNPERRARPDAEALREAAAVAAWYSEARSEAAVDVQWTRRKYVRKARGGVAGAVVIKRFETVRVAPGLPPGQSEEI